jgi:hypothetical protein
MMSDDDETRILELAESESDFQKASKSDLDFT